MIDVLPRNENTTGLGSSGVNSQTTLEHSVPNILKKCQHILFLDNEVSVLTSSADCEGESLKCKDIGLSRSRGSLDVELKGVGYSIPLVMR